MTFLKPTDFITLFFSDCEVNNSWPGDVHSDSIAVVSSDSDGELRPTSVDDLKSDSVDVVSSESVDVFRPNSGVKVFSIPCCVVLLELGGVVDVAFVFCYISGSSTSAKKLVSSIYKADACGSIKKWLENYCNVSFYQHHIILFIKHLIFSNFLLENLSGKVH